MKICFEEPGKVLRNKMVIAPSSEIDQQYYNHVYVIIKTKLFSGHRILSCHFIFWARLLKRKSIFDFPSLNYRGPFAAHTYPRFM